MLTDLLKAAEQEVLYRPERRDVILQDTTKLFELSPQNHIESIFRILPDREPAAFIRPLGRECTDGHKSVGLDNVSCQCDVFAYLLFLRKEMEGCPVMPDIIFSRGCKL